MTTPAFGQAAGDYVPGEFDEDDVWILGFKVGETQIRIAPATMINEKGIEVHGTTAWPTERMHYDEDLKTAYPCSERFNIECGGCKHPNKKVRDRSRNYFINALDGEGNNRIFKMGVKLFKVFQGREQRALGRDPKNLQPLSDRDYIVIRTGSGMNDTSYDPEPGDAYEVDFPSDLHDIPTILGAKWKMASDFYANGEGGPIQDTKPAAKDEEAKQKPVGSTRIQPKAKEAEPEEGKAPANEDPKWFTNPAAEDLDDATTEELKGFLTRREQEFPARAARSRLLAQAKELLEPPY